MFPFILDEGLPDLFAGVGYVVADVVHLFLFALDFVGCSAMFGSVGGYVECGGSKIVL